MDRSIARSVRFKLSDLLPGRGREVNPGDRVFLWVLRGAAISIVALFAWIAFQVGRQAWPALTRFGWGFATSQAWDPVRELYGALPSIFGTLVSSALALAIATPLSVGVALFLSELAPPRLATIVGFLVQMLAAIPSVVYGLWGIFVLAPWLRQTVEPTLSRWLGFLPIFQGAPYGVGMLAAGVVLAVMVIPTISAISLEVFRAVPRAQREAALAMGSTKWEMISLSVLQSSRSGVFSAAILGLGRALGETMAVTMVIGNRPAISASLFAPAQTMASVIANEYAEATSDMHLSALAAIGFCLFVVTFGVNALARLLIRRAA